MIQYIISYRNVIQIWRKSFSKTLEPFLELFWSSLTICFVFFHFNIIYNVQIFMIIVVSIQRHFEDHLINNVEL